MLNARFCQLLTILLCLTTVRAVTKTITINAPTSGADLNPVGAAINTKLHAKIYNSPYAYGQYSTYGVAGLGSGLYGYSGGYESYGGYATPLSVYGGFPSYQYGYPYPVYASYNVNTIYPDSKAAYNGLYQGTYANLGAYPNGKYNLNNVAGSYTGYSFLSYDLIDKLKG